MAASKCKLGVKRRYYQRRTIESEFGVCLEGSEGWIFVESVWLNINEWRRRVGNIFGSDDLALRMTKVAILFLQAQPCK